MLFRSQAGARQSGIPQGQPLQPTGPGGEIRFGTQNGETGTTPLLPPDVGGLVGPVEVTILDNQVVINARIASDMILVRQIIEYIEAMSREYDPIIVEVPMIHGNCLRVADIAQQMYSTWYLEQRGQISITPLTRPNSILLIGYQGSIQAAQELIAKLDQPIDAQAQFQVFRLRHANAATLKSTLDEFYTARTSTAGGTGSTIISPQGLASTVTITSDLRTNSLVVQAAPRDLLELSALIMKLDKADNEVEMTIEIIPLRNTTASTLATLLNQALTGQTLTSTTGGGGGAGGAAAQQVTAPQSGVTFTTIDAQRGEQVLSSGVFSGVSVVADVSSNKLLVKAPPECMPTIRAVIANLDDTPLAVAQMKIFTIINSDASTLYTMLGQIFQTTTTGGGAAGSTMTNYRLGESSNENSFIVPVRFASDTRTNSIIATGSADMLAMVEAILLTLDEPDMHNRSLMIYRLINTPASSIASTLQTFLQSERQWRQQSQALVGEVDLFNAEVIITAETETNSLLVSTTPRYFEQLRRMIQILDERPPMVKIQVLIGEVDISNTDEIGFELGLQDSLLFDRSVAGNPGFNFNNNPLGNDVTASPQNVGTQGLSNFSMGRANSELGYGGFVFAASSESVSVLVRALEERGKLTVLNRPMLNVLHNQSAEISVGERVQLVSGTNTNNYGGQNNTFTERRVGIGVSVTPRIALDDSVSMLIHAEKSSIGPENEGTAAFVDGGVTVRIPKIKESLIETTIQANSGQVAVLGGLITSEEQATRRAVPVVSNIPLLGQLFQYNYKHCSRKEIVFIFSPQVYRSQDEADALKQLELQRMHWVSRHVRNMIDSDNVRTRTDDYTSSDTIIERGGGIRLDTNEAPSDERLINQSTNQDRMIPQGPATMSPSPASSFPRPAR